MCPLQDELDDILRYGAAELFADAVAAGQQAQQAGASTDKGVSSPLCVHEALSCIMKVQQVCQSVVPSSSIGAISASFATMRDQRVVPPLLFIDVAFLDLHLHQLVLMQVASKATPHQRLSSWTCNGNAVLLHVHATEANSISVLWDMQMQYSRDACACY